MLRKLARRTLGARIREHQRIAGLPLLIPADFTGDLSRPTLEAAIRARCHTVPVDQHTVLCRVLGRYKFLVDSRDLGLAPHLMLDGYWEYWATDFIARRLRPGQVAWDVGANLGYYAVLMADMVGPAGRVRAIEPNPHFAALAERNLALNGFTSCSTVHRIAASDRTGGTLRFRASHADPKNGHLVPAGAAALGNDDDMVEVTVGLARLDDIATEAVDFMKIDVEGAEEAVWAGMQGLLNRSPDITVLLEFNAARCTEPQRMLNEIAARFPLRELDLHARVQTVTAEEILPRREDTLLVLTNRPL